MVSAAEAAAVAALVVSRVMAAAAIGIAAIAKYDILVLTHRPVIADTFENYFAASFHAPHEVGVIPIIGVAVLRGRFGGRIGV